MVRYKNKVDFSLIKETIFKLFDHGDGYHYPYTKHVASKLRNSNCGFMDILEWKLNYVAGYSIRRRLQTELERIFKEKIEPRFIPTGDVLIDQGRLYNHQQIKKECKKKRWQKKLTRHVHDVISTIRTREIEPAEGYLFYGIIEEYICDLYNIKNDEQQLRIPKNIDNVEQQQSHI